MPLCPRARLEISMMCFARNKYSGFQCKSLKETLFCGSDFQEAVLYASVLKRTLLFGKKDSLWKKPVKWNSGSFALCKDSLPEMTCPTGSITPVSCIPAPRCSPVPLHFPGYCHGFHGGKLPTPYVKLLGFFLFPFWVCAMYQSHAAGFIQP